MQAVLLLLGGRDIPTGVPTVELSFDQNDRVNEYRNWIMERVESLASFNQYYIL